MVILGIETSCDETALALLETRAESSAPDRMIACRVLASLVHSQAQLHNAYGGVYPTLAKREHGRNLVPLLDRILGESGIAAGRQETPSGPLPEGSFGDIAAKDPDLYRSFISADFLKGPKPAIDAIAVTEGPGLEPALWVGINFARMLGELWQIPVIPIDHMEGHIVGSLLPEEAIRDRGSWHRLYEAPLPAVALLVSGGHTELVKVSSIGVYEVIGETVDDAVGEAFDKTARLLGLPYPGGPRLSELAKKASDGGLPAPVKLPRPMISSKSLDFSFSGLKTAVLYAVRKAQERADGSLSDDFKAGLAYEFEQAVSDVLESKSRAAVREIGAKSMIVGGGVAANVVLQRRLESVASDNGIPIFMPSGHVSGDNALMIALAAAVHPIRKAAVIAASGNKRL